MSFIFLQLCLREQRIETNAFICNKMAHFCISCKQTVTSRQEAILCDGCERWQHRICGTNISRKDYRAAVRSGRGIDWCCVDCLNMSTGFLIPEAESTSRTLDNISGKCVLYYINLHSC